MVDLALEERRGTPEEALARRDWEEAARLFAEEIVRSETARALEGYATACWWLDDADAVIDARSRAYVLYQRQGDRLAAARVATALGRDFASFRGQLAVAAGWLRRAHRLLAGFESSEEHGWLAVHEAEAALFYRADTTAALAHAADAAATAELLGLVDVEVVALALRGLALVAAGAVDEGMAQLDEAGAAISAGELSALEWVGVTYCCFIYAFEDVRDLERAVQWCERLLDFCGRSGIRSGSALCQAHDAGVLVSRGSWAAAEAKLEAAAGELAATRPPFAADALVRLGELRRRQGRLDEAAALFDLAEGHPRAALGRAALLLDRGEPTEAAASAASVLVALDAGGRGERAAALELVVEAEIAAGRRPDLAVAKLEAVAAEAGTPALVGSAAYAAGLVAEAAGRYQLAVNRFEEAVALLVRAGTPFEAARARVALARSLAATGRPRAAHAEARRALASFDALGAAFEREAAERLVRRLGRRGVPSETLGLSRREVEVVRLLAEGLSNSEIAVRLVLSEHTAHRHVANVLRKLRVHSRAAAVGRAAEAGLI